MNGTDQGFLRLSKLPDDALSDLGPLQALVGTWFGNHGWNLIAVPEFDPKMGPVPFRLEIMHYSETIVFSPIGALVPNKNGKPGFMQVPGLQYELKVADSETNQPLHVENGMWLRLDYNVPPADGFSVARLATIPHGDSVLALGKDSRIAGPPTIPEVSSLPDIGGAPFGYTDPYIDPNAPPKVPIDKLNLPKVLQDIIDRMPPTERIVETVILDVTAGSSSRINPQPAPGTPVGGVTNIPYIVQNANAGAFASTFWIETVKVDGASPFLQLQYSQEVDLLFLERLDHDQKINGGKILWPHVTVNTLLKQ